MSRPSGGRFGIILAAGKGARFHGLKQFAKLNGKPLLLYSLLAFERCQAVTGYVLVANPTSLRKTRQLVGGRRFKRLLAIVPGGTLRADSVASGLKALPDSGCVAIHDSARPFITTGMLEAGFRACRKFRAATYGLPVTDTLKFVRDGLAIRTVDRSSLVAIQTPQFFELQLIKHAHTLPRKREATDDCALVEQLGIRPIVLAGSPRNVKVTTRADLRLCEALR